jgi:hypothetical protein
MSQLNIIYISSTGGVRTVEQNLLEDIFHDYNKQARPVIDPDDAAQIYISLAISKLDDLVCFTRISSLE